MDRRSVLGLSLLAAGVGGVGYAVFAPVNDEELIAETLDALAETLCFEEPISNPVFFGSRLSENFQDLMTEQIDIRVSEVRSRLPSHRGQLGLAAAQALQMYGSLSVSFSIESILLSNDTAEVEATATVMGVFRGEMKRDKRPVHFGMTRVDGDWRVASAKVHPPR